MAKTDYNLRKFFIVVAVVVGVLLVVSFWSRSFVRGRAEVNKFLFTADTSNIVRSTNPWRMSESLSFVLGNYPYSLEGIIKLYGKIADENSWQINSGKDFNFNEKNHRIDASKNGHDLFINLERLGGGDRVLININYDIILNP